MNRGRAEILLPDMMDKVSNAISIINEAGMNEDKVGPANVLRMALNEEEANAVYDYIGYTNLLQCIKAKKMVSNLNETAKRKARWRTL